MKFEEKIAERSGNACELCFKTENLSIEDIKGQEDESNLDEYIHICESCNTKIKNANHDANEWHFLSESIWNPTPSVQVITYRLLNNINNEWAQNLKSQMYLEDSVLEWAQATTEKVIHIDSNGAVLNFGDSIQLTQDLKVKGANFNAPKGTIVRKISLVRDNAEQIEGKINNQTIVILTKYVKKA